MEVRKSSKPTLAVNLVSERKLRSSCIILKICLFVLIYFHFCQLRAHWTSLRVGSGYRVTWAMPYSFSNEPSGSFTCRVYSTDTWDLGLSLIRMTWSGGGSNSRPLVSQFRALPLDHGPPVRFQMS